LEERTALGRLAKDPNARPEIMIFGAKQYILDRYSAISEVIRTLKEKGKLEWKSEPDNILQRHLFPLLHSGTRGLMYLAAAYQTDYFDIPISQLSFLESSVEGVFSSIRKLADNLSSRLIGDMFKIRNLFECIDIKSQVCGPVNPKPYKSDPAGMKIEVKDVMFRYGEKLAPVLKDVSFTVEAGQLVSIVGYNGSGYPPRNMLIIGKSTLIRLLTLLEKPTSGNIFINDIDVSEYDPNVLRTNMSILFQDFRKHLSIH
jgi:ATP-binding cassette, subfamily B, bacterial